MNEAENKGNDVDDSPAEINPFSSQSTGLVETTFAETLGLSMHNAITNQQNAQMTASASITNACARLLQTPNKKNKDASEDSDETQEGADGDAQNSNVEKDALSKKSKTWLNVKNFMKRKPKETPAPPPEKTNEDEEKPQAPNDPTNEEK